jgi:hypothetical protein
MLCASAAKDKPPSKLHQRSQPRQHLTFKRVYSKLVAPLLPNLLRLRVAATPAAHAASPAVRDAAMSKGSTGTADAGVDSPQHIHAHAA